MRNELSEYFRPTEDEFKALWKDATFSFDANAILGLYRWSEQTRKLFIEVLELLDGRIWLTYQAALEYLRNKHSVINEQEKRATQFSFSHLEAYRKQLDEYKRHPTLDHAELARFLSEFEEKTKTYVSTKSLGDYHKICENVDLKLLKMFDKRVGKRPSKDELDELISQSKKRYESLLPPGYCDLKEKEAAIKKERESPTGKVLGDPYGDAIMWLQLIDQGKKCGAVVLVTDDAKEDWWEIYGGKTIRPRVELLREMKDNKIRFYLYKSEQFLTYANDFLKVPVEQTKLDDVVSEISQTREKKVAAHELMLFSPERKATWYFPETSPDGPIKISFPGEQPSRFRRYRRNSEFGTEEERQQEILNNILRLELERAGVKVEDNATYPHLIVQARTYVQDPLIDMIAAAHSYIMQRRGPDGLSLDELYNLDQIIEILERRMQLRTTDS